MSEAFVRTDTGALNLRYVRRFREVEDQHGIRHFAVMDDGKEIAVSLGAEALDHLCQRVVPAAAGDAACFLNLDGETGNPTIDDVHEQHVKIVAWGLSINYGGGTYGVEPIFADKPASNQTAFIACPDGSWLLQEDASFATLTEAKEEVLRRHHWRRDHGDG